jgi:hypothetical protein
MPSEFAITASSSLVQLDGQRQGETSFTVSNAGARPVRGRAFIAAYPPASPEWFSIAGDVERAFSVGGTHQYTVQCGDRQLLVPPGRGERRQS